MKQTIIKDQAECLAILLKHGMLGQIKPMDPRNPGCTSMFTISETSSCIADLKAGKYTLMLLADCTFNQASEVYRNIVNGPAFNGAPLCVKITPHVEFNPVNS